MSKTFLITGGAGFIGSTVVRERDALKVVGDQIAAPHPRTPDRPGNRTSTASATPD